MIKIFSQPQFAGIVGSSLLSWITLFTQSQLEKPRVIGVSGESIKRFVNTAKKRKEKNLCQRRDYEMRFDPTGICGDGFFLGVADVRRRGARLLRVGSGCAGAAPGLCPAGRVCCPTAALTGSAAAAPGSSRTRSPTAHSLSMAHTHTSVSISNARTARTYKLNWVHVKKLDKPL